MDTPAGSNLTDPARIAALRRTALLDSPPEEAFDRLTRLAHTALHTPMALVTLVDGDRQFFKSSIGLPEPWASRCESPLSYSQCLPEPEDLAIHFVDGRTILALNVEVLTDRYQSLLQLEFWHSILFQAKSLEREWSQHVSRGGSAAVIRRDELGGVDDKMRYVRTVGIRSGA